jgi:sucrose-6-phosphate hydrolase SacC (GH32 family)
VQSSSEPLRPQFHFTAPSGWLNDPNGLVYRDGQYHLFYQHNPKGTAWGNMTWGHATSPDLIHWRDLPNALEPDSLGTIFSGSAVIDYKNASGLGSKSHPPMLCFYTAAGGTNDASKGKPFTQCLAYSLDGVSFTKYAHNPIIPNIVKENRDPKVVWDPDHKIWLLALYLSNSTYTLFSSSNLTSWTRLSDVSFPGTDECPDFFRMPIEGSNGQYRWVFSGANGRYMVGSFDGQNFYPEGSPRETNFGNTGYAGQTYSNAPNGETIQITWMRSSDFPGCTWNQQMSFPNLLKLHQGKDGQFLTLQPVPSITTLEKGSLELRGHRALSKSGQFIFTGGFHPLEPGTLDIQVNGITITFDAKTSLLSALGKQVKVNLPDNYLELKILADVTTVEIYAQDGAV